MTARLLSVRGPAVARPAPPRAGRRLARKGTRAEHRARRALEAIGYVVARSAGSRGPFDLVALKDSDVLLVQVKAGTPARDPAKLYQADLARLVALDVVAMRQLWVWIDREGWLVWRWDGQTWRLGAAPLPVAQRAAAISHRVKQSGTVAE